MNRVDSRTLSRDYLRFCARDDEDMFVVRRLRLDVDNLFVDVALHASTQRRVKLSEVANLQRIADFRLATADFREEAIIATSSSASFSSGSTCFSLRILEPMINSNQNAVSSASSSATPIFAMNSARDRTRQAAR